MFYVYWYKDPRTKLPFYIGKGIRDRAYVHLIETEETTVNIRKYNRIQEIFDLGLQPIIEFLRFFKIEHDAYEHEEALILYYGRDGYEPNGILTNLSIRSRPPVQKGRKWSDEQRARHRLRMKEAAKYMVRRKNIPWNKGRIGLQVAWNKGQTGFPGRKHTEETKQRLRDLSTGKTKSPETRAKMSLNMKGRIPWNKGKTSLQVSHNAIECLFVSPDGLECHYQSMRQGCIDLNLPTNKMCEVKNGKLPHYKGWKVVVNVPAEKEMT